VENNACVLFPVFPPALTAIGKPCFIACLDLKMNMNRNIILIADLCGCETWSVMLREAHRLRVFENRLLKKMFGPKREEVTRNIYVDPWFIYSYSQIPPDSLQQTTINLKYIKVSGNIKH
jgi:hypothetical protein